MAKTRVAVFSLAGLLLASAPAPAAACVCSESEGLAADFAEAEAVFAGRVVALELSEERVGELVVEDMTATIQVERLWKGPTDKLLRVHTCGTQTQLCTCGTDFKVGARFVVFAVGEPLGTGSCQRTREYTRVEKEPSLQWLGAEKLIRELDALMEQ